MATLFSKTVSFSTVRHIYLTYDPPIRVDEHQYLQAVVRERTYESYCRISGRAISNWRRPTGRPSQNATILEIGYKRVAALHATLYTLETQFKKRTVELEMQVIAQRKAEECLRELTTRTLKLQDDQARRIARELHDSAGQYLAAIQMNLSALERDSSSLTTSASKANLRLH